MFFFCGKPLRNIEQEVAIITLHFRSLLCILEITMGRAKTGGGENNWKAITMFGVVGRRGGRQCL